MISLHADSAWQPGRPSDRLLDSSYTGKAWTRYLKRQGYAGDELGEVIEGVPGDSRHPGLGLAVADGLAAREPDDRGSNARAGLVVAYLERRPPLAVLSLSPAPPRYLSPALLGARLRSVGRGHDLGALYQDVITSSLWVVVSPTPRARARMIAASALYDCVGIAAIRWRLVELDDRLALTAREPTHWHPLERGDHADDLERQRPADVWLANGRGPVGIRKRLNPIPGLPAVVRWNLRGALESTGAKLTSPTSEHLPMLRRITRVADGKIRRSVQVSGLTGEAAALLYGTIVTRREVLRADLDRLTGAAT